MTPIERYQSDIKNKGFIEDSAQCQAIVYLDQLYQKLVWQEDPKKAGFLHAITHWWASKKAPELKGLYFWGGVGRGKTYLMDVFFDALPFEQKMRTHFHRFMRQIHQELTRLEGVSDPLTVIASSIAKETRVLCFDEFFVSDITDAMILARLLDGLFSQGVVLVTTSNIEPHNLYLNGLQRANFLPAISLLETHTQVVNVDAGIDYRLRTLEQAELFHSPNDRVAQEALSYYFSQLVSTSQHCKKNTMVEIEGRQIPVFKEADDVAWFDFYDLCDGPRSQNDYIELAKEYHTVILSGIPCLGEKNDDQARRFIYLVDEFYDRCVKLIMSADKPYAEIYGQGRLSFEFQRTVSRIQEMQSTEYLAREHKA